DPGTDVGWNRDNTAVHDKPADRLQVLPGVRNQTLLTRMVFLYFLEDFDRFFAWVDFSRSVIKNLLFASQLAHSDVQNFFRRQLDQFAVTQHLLEFLTAQRVAPVRLRQFLLL